jgi:hypothetical protein
MSTLADKVMEKLQESLKLEKKPHQEEKEIKKRTESVLESNFIKRLMADTKSENKETKK